MDKVITASEQLKQGYIELHNAIEEETKENKSPEVIALHVKIDKLRKHIDAINTSVYDLLYKNMHNETKTEETPISIADRISMEKVIRRYAEQYATAIELPTGAFRISLSPYLTVDMKVSSGPQVIIELYWPQLLPELGASIRSALHLIKTKGGDLWTPMQLKESVMYKMNKNIKWKQTDIEKESELYTKHIPAYRVRVEVESIRRYIDLYTGKFIEKKAMDFYHPYEFDTSDELIELAQLVEDNDD